MLNMYSKAIMVAELTSWGEKKRLQIEPKTIAYHHTLPTAISSNPLYKLFCTIQESPGSE